MIPPRRCSLTALMFLVYRVCFLVLGPERMVTTLWKGWSGWRALAKNCEARRLMCSSTLRILVSACRMTDLTGLRGWLTRRRWTGLTRLRY
jgi:hypothetical protein